MAVPIYIPTNCVGRFPFLYISSAFIDNRFFDDSHFEWCEVIPHYSFGLHFSDSLVELLFICHLAICIYSLERYQFGSRERCSYFFLNFTS